MIINKIKSFFASLGQHAKGVILFLFGAGILTAAFSIGGDIYIENKRLNNEARFRVLDIQREYLSEIESLYESFSDHMADLASDNSPPLDLTLKDSMLDNLRMQDQRLSALLASGYEPNDGVINNYRDNLLEIRQALISSDDPGQVRNIFLLVAKMVENKNQLSETLLSQDGNGA